MSEFSINELNLIGEWKKQIDLVEDYGEQLAVAKENYETLKRKVKVVEAEIRLEILRDPKSFGVEKPNIDTVNSLIAVNVGVEDAYEKMYAAKHKMDLLQVAIDTLHDRRKGLENASSLFIGKYWSMPEDGKQIPAPSSEDTIGGMVRKRRRRRRSSD